MPRDDTVARMENILLALLMCRLKEMAGITSHFKSFGVITCAQIEQ